MIKHHAKHKKRHENSSREEARTESSRQAGFLSFDLKKFMNRQDKFLVIAISLGVVVLFAGAIYLILNRGGQGETPEVEIDPKKVITTPYPTIPLEIKDTTVLINSRAINPQVVKIITGGSVGFLNEDSTPVTIQGYDAGSEILNIGEVEPYDIPVVVFDKPGTYRYINSQNPTEIAEIIVE